MVKSNDDYQISLFPSLLEVSAITYYKLTITFVPTLNPSYPQVSNISIDFSSSDLTINDGPLSICNFTGCFCSNKICFFPLNTIIVSYTPYTIIMGNFTNPPSIKDQPITVVINFNSTPWNITNVNTIGGSSYTAGLIYNQNLFQGSFKRAAITNCTITFNIQHKILINGEITLTFPSIPIPDILLNNKYVKGVYWKSYTDVNENIVSFSISSQMITLSNLFPQNPLLVNDTGYLSIRIDGIQNPSNLMNTTSIIITTTDSQGNTIDQCGSGLIVQSTIPGDIVIEKIQALFPNPTTINLETVIFIQIAPEVIYRVNGSLEIDFPAQFSFNNQKFTCITTNLLDNPSSIGGYCNRTGTTIFINNQYYPSLTGIMISIYGVINPNSTATTDSFYFQTYDNVGKVICKSYLNFTYSATPNVLNILQMNRSATLAGNSFNLTVNAITTDAFPQGGFIKLLIPLDQAILANALANCYITNNNSISSQICLTINNTNTNTVEIWINEWCSAGKTTCPAGFNLNFQINYSLINPYFISQNLLPGCSITTYGPDKNIMYDQITTTILPSAIPIPINFINFTRYSSNFTGDFDTYDIQIEINDYFLAYGGSIKLYYPDNAAGSLSIYPISCSLINSSNIANSRVSNFSTYSTSKMINILQVLDVCQSHSCSSSKILLRLNNIRNPISLKPLDALNNTNFYGVQMLTLDNKIIAFSTTNNVFGISSIASSFHNLNTQISDTTTTKLVSYTFSFQTSVEIPQTGSIVLNFPTEIQLTNISTCQIAVNTISYSTINCSVYSINCTITHSVDPSSFLFLPNITISISNILNPRSLATSSNFTLSSKTYDSYNIQSSQFNVTMGADSILFSATLTRTNIFLNNATILYLQFMSFTDIYATDIIQIYFSKDQIIKNGSDNINIESMNINPSKNLTFTIISNDPNFLAVNFSDPNCNPCRLTNTLNYKIYGFLNIGTTKLPNLSNQIFIKDSKGYLIEEKSLLFQVKPNLAAGNLTIISFTFNNITTGADTNLTIIFRTQNAVNNGSIFLFFPVEYLYVANININKACFAVLNNTDYKCNINLINGLNLGESINLTIISNFTCNANSIISLTIYNTLKNKPSNQLLNEYNLSIFTLDSSNNTIDSCVENANNNLPQQFNNFNNPIFKRNNNVVSSNTDLFINFSILNRVPNNTNFIISLPQSQISSYINSTCLGYYLNDYNLLPCTIYSKNDMIVISFQEFCSKNNTGVPYCQENSYFSLKIKYLMNNISVPNSMDYSIQLISSTADGLYFYEQRTSNLYFTDNLQMSNFINFTLSMNETRVTMPALINIGFTIPSIIPQNGSIMLNFTENLFFLSLDQCYFSFISNLNSINSCQILKNASNYGSFQISSINLTNVCLISNNCLANNTINLSFIAINQPYYFKSSYQYIGLQSYTIDNQNISIYKYNASNLNLSSYNIDNFIFVSRDNPNLNQSANFRIDFIVPSLLISNASLKFYLPKNQININSSTLQINLLSPAIKSNISYLLDANDSNYYFLTIAQTFCANYCNSNTNISLNLLNCMNPALTVYTNFNAFLLNAYYEIESQFIYSTTNGVTVTPDLNIPSLLNISLSRTSQFLNDSITMTINFTIPSTLNRILTDNTWFSLFPDNLIYIDDLNKSPEVLLFYNSGNYNNLTNLLIINKIIDKYGNYFLKSIQIPKFCNGVCTVGQVLIMKIANIRNPTVFFTNLNNQNLTLLILNQNSFISNQLIISSINIQPLINLLDIQIFSLNRNTSSSNSTSQISLEFELKSYLLQGSYIYINIPKIQMLLTNTSYCVNQINNDTISCNIAQNSTFYTISFQEYCSNLLSNCASAEYFSIIITNCINPSKTPQKISSNSFEIMAYSIFYDLYQIFNDSIFLSPDIYEFYLNSINITRSNNVAGSVATYNFQIYLPQTVASNVVFIVNFPGFLAYNPTNSNFNCKSYICQSFTLNPYNYTYQMVIINFCFSGGVCLINNVISLSFDLKNQGNTYDYQTNQNFSIIIESNDQSTDIARGDITANTLSLITPGTFLSAAITSSSYQVGKTMSWGISFVLSNNFLNTDNLGKITINLPNSIGFLSTSTCSVNIGKFGNGICLLSIVDQVIYLTHNYPNTSSMSSSQIIISISDLINPLSKKPTNSLIITSVAQINNQIVKFDEKLTGLIYQCLTAGDILSISFIRDKTDLGVEIILNLNFTTSTQNDNNGLILINIINSDEVDFSPTTPISCINRFDNSSFNCTKFITTGLLMLSNLSNYASNNIWSLQIIGLKNKYYVDQFIGNTYSFSIETRTYDNYQIDLSTSIIHAQPILQYGSLNIKGISRSSDIIANEIYMNIQMTFSNKIYQNSSFLKITLPNEYLLISKSFNLNCSINEDSFPCSYTLYWDNYSIKELRISNLNVLNQIVALNLTFNSGLKNSFFVNSNAQSLLLQTYLIISTKNVNGLLDQSIINSNDFLNVLNQQYIYNASISCIDCAINQMTDWIIRFEIYHIFLHDILIKFEIPSNLVFQEFLYGDQKCEGLIGFNTNIDCFSSKNIVWINDSYNVIMNPGLYSFKIKNIQNPVQSSNYAGFNLSSYYNNSYLMDLMNQDLILSINDRNNSYICDTYCQTCTQNLSECLSCYFPSYYPFYNPFQKKCLNQCPEGTFLSSQLTCETCYNSCKTCDGSKISDCLTCDNGLYFSDGSCVDKCPDNTTNNNSYCVNNTCNDNCDLCGLNKSYCITCKPGNFYDNATKSCLNNTKCSNNYYYSNGTCQLCESECLTCEFNASNCTNCVDFFNKDKLIIINNTGLCQSQCPDHYYNEKNIITTKQNPLLTIIDYFCKPCDGSCLTCQYSTANSCLSCNTSNTSTKFLEYGTCVANCNESLIQVNISTCMENCSNSKCYKCSSGNTSQCLECQDPYSYLLNSQCYLQQEICNNTHQYILSTNPYNCSNCSIKCKTCTNSSSNCLSCYNQLNTPNGINQFSFLYDNQCVAMCPAGFSPAYGDDMICKDFVCSTPCKTCAYNQSTCYECDENTPYLYNYYCYIECPSGTLYDYNLKFCVKADNGLSKIWASWIVLAVFLILAGYFIFSLIFLRTVVNIGSSLICLLQIIEFLSKLFMFGFFFSLRELTACIFCFVNLVNNCVLSMIFQTLYVGVLEIHINSFALFKSKNKKFYYFVLVGMLFFGINFAFAFSSGLFKFVKSEFETNFNYSKGLDRMLLIGFIFALMQTGIDCFILNKYTVDYDVFHLAYINLIMNIAIYSVLAFKKIIILMEKSKKLMNKKP